MQVTALLPMKGHSERVPSKNLKEFAGRPLYHAVLEQLLAARHVERVVVNTDSEALLEDLERHFPGVLRIRRPEAICGDLVSMNRIIAHDLSVLSREEEHFLQTHSTNPLLRATTIDRAIERYFESLGRCDSLFSVTPWQTRLYWEDGRPVNHDPKVLLRTQDLPTVYEENSNLYLFSRESFTGAGECRIGRQPLIYPTPRLEAVDIDEPEDFEVAEILYIRRYGRA